jgi:hypothetical protein
LKLARELELSGLKMDVNKLVSIMIVVGVVLLIAIASVLYFLMHYQFIIAAAAGIGSWGLFIAVMYLVIEYFIDKRKTKMESVLPDYFMLAAANLRSGISLDRSLMLAGKPEFEPLTTDINDMGKRLFSGETMNAALTELGSKYRSVQLQHSLRMISESLRYGGAIADLLNQLSKDLRAQALIQKEISGQMLMYSIFIVFAGLIAAPMLYGLTSQMISITTRVWTGILAENPNGLPSTGVSFLRPSAPKVTVAEYSNFSLLAIIIITGFAGLIMSAMSNGSIVKGLKYVPVFIVIGLLIYIGVGTIVASLFTNIGNL